MNEARMEKPTPLLRFLRRPELNEHAPGRLTLWHWLGWLCLLLLIGFAGGAFDNALIRIFGWTVPPNSFENYLLTHVSWKAAAIVAVAPLLEELGFRAMLSTAPKPVFVGLAFFFTYTYVLLHLNLMHRPPAYVIAHSFDANWVLWVLIPACLASLLLYRYAREPVLKLFRAHGVVIFWVSCILFGAGHAAVYANHLTWWVFLLAIPQFLLGVLLASMRVRFGLRWSIAAHYAIDSLLIYGAWLYLAVAHESVLQHGLMFAYLGIGAFIMVYGLVTLVRVARGRW